MTEVGCLFVPAHALPYPYESWLTIVGSFREVRCSSYLEPRSLSIVRSTPYTADMLRSQEPFIRNMGHGEPSLIAPSTDYALPLL